MRYVTRWIVRLLIGGNDSIIEAYFAYFVAYLEHMAKHIWGFGGAYLARG